MTTPDTPDGDDPDTDDDTVFEQLDEAESLDNPDLDDPLDEGVSPNEQPWGTTAWGVTPEEEEEGEPLADRLRREVPDTTRTPTTATASATSPTPTASSATTRSATSAPDGSS